MENAIAPAPSGEPSEAQRPRTCGPNKITIYAAKRLHLTGRSKRQNMRFVLSRLKSRRPALPFRP